MSVLLPMGFIGAGKMASALARGILRASLATPDQIMASDVLEGAREHFARELNTPTSSTNAEVVRFANVVVLAVKPDQVAGVLEEVRPYVTDHHLLISIAAGITLKKLQEGLFEGARVVRVMPNTPALIGVCASAYALGEWATEEDGETARRLFASVGTTFAVKEHLLDAVTGLSGSGPAYVYLMIEALSDGGVAAGLPREAATKLAAQTVLGAARMVLETGLHPGALKDMVTSPAGTTIEGIHELEKAGVRGALMNAVRAATQRARALGQG
ncbi:MAG: pyrroline-5-carboxylate reductase [Verrucomicrobia bacterium]|nr:pyrroline-5-carboxylate reductase [Verrucomicrobiota bacterium]